MPHHSRRLSAAAYADGILSGNRLILSRAITLVESQLAADKALADEVLQRVLPHTGKSVRVGITGVPGVGKSTFIEAFGKHITSLPKKVAVLAVDPSSQRTRGSILGDKTRMETLSRNPMAYIRPSPTGRSLGGVARRTRQALLLCEAAGYEWILVETVGVGQSETAVRGMVDFFLLLLLAGAGDELQGMKKGIIEMADAIAITKADGENLRAASQARNAYENALHILPPSEMGWQPPVRTCSALTGESIEEIAQIMDSYVQQMQANGYFSRNRQQQNAQWMHELIQQALTDRVYENPRIKSYLTSLEEAVRNGEIPPTTAAQRVLNLMK